MREVDVEEILEIFFPLSSLVCSYSCPAMDAIAQTTVHVGGGNLGVDATLVIDVGLVYDTLPEQVREVLLCLYGARMSVRGTARRVRCGKSHVHRFKNEGLQMMRRGLMERGVKLSDDQRLKYG